MDSVTNNCKYEYQCFMAIMQVKVISGHPVKRSNQKENLDMALQYMFLGQIFAKNAKNDSKTFFFEN